MNTQHQQSADRTARSDAFDVLVNDEVVSVDSDLLTRYSGPIPRYTSYPTALEWHDLPTGKELRLRLGPETARAPRPLSIYVHIPFCRSLCLFCGCNVLITRDETAADRYLDYLEREIAAVAADIDQPQPVEQLHIGGGTPTFLTTEQLRRLHGMIVESFEFAPDAEIAIEVEPRVTTAEQLYTLRELGFNRLSMGIQDFDPIVQKTIRRVHSFEVVADLINAARSVEYDSINVDLIYGLPHQTIEGYQSTLASVAELNPDRIALFSYAHVPWLKKQQGALRHHLPDTAEKFQIFAMAVRELTRYGYRHLGMDHFVKPTDELSLAFDAGTLHRNFQGYTTRKGCDLLGFGVSAIGDLGDLYVQNERKVDDYYRVIDTGRLPTARSCNLTSEDLLRREIIESIMCRGEFWFAQVSDSLDEPFDAHFSRELDAIRQLQPDDLVVMTSDSIKLTPRGKLFVRNVASIFDAYLPQNEPLHKTYSSAI